MRVLFSKTIHAYMRDPALFSPEKVWASKECELLQHDSPILHITSGDDTRQYSTRTKPKGVVVPPPSHADVYEGHEVEPRMTPKSVVLPPSSHANVYGRHEVEPWMTPMPKSLLYVFLYIS